jgi:hypothetical protein
MVSLAVVSFRKGRATPGVSPISLENQGFGWKRPVPVPALAKVVMKA